MDKSNEYIDELVDKDEKIINLWGKRTPRFEKQYEGRVLRKITDYGIGASENTSAKGKILGAGYEAYIMAFFIGLYSNKRLSLSDEPDDIKVLGQPLQYWGNLDSKKNRHAYPDLRKYIFIALVAKTEVDWIALDKGEVNAKTVVAQLISTMEQYANYGFSVMAEKLEENEGYFSSNRSFLDIFLQLAQPSKKLEEVENDQPEDL